MTEHGAGMVVKRFDEHFFGGLCGIAVTLTGAPIAAGKPQIHPVSGPIDSARKALRVNEGLQEKQPMAKMFLPIQSQPSLAQRENLRAEIPMMPTGQDQKPAVVGNEFEPVIIVLMVKIPADPSIAHRAFPGGGRKAQQRHPLLVISGHVPHSLTDLWQIPQVVMFGHQAPIKRLFVPLNRTHSDVMEVQTDCFPFP